MPRFTSAVFPLAALGDIGGQMVRGTFAGRKLAEEEEANRLQQRHMHFLERLAELRRLDALVRLNRPQLLSHEGHVLAIDPNTLEERGRLAFPTEETPARKAQREASETTTALHKAQLAGTVPPTDPVKRLEAQISKAREDGDFHRARTLEETLAALSRATKSPPAPHVSTHWGTDPEGNVTAFISTTDPTGKTTTERKPVGPGGHPERPRVLTKEHVDAVASGVVKDSALSQAAALKLQADQEGAARKKHSLANREVADWPMTTVPVNAEGNLFTGSPETLGREVMQQGYRPFSRPIYEEVRQNRQAMTMIRQMRSMAWRLQEKGKLPLAASLSSRLAANPNFEIRRVTKDPDIMVWVGMESEMIMSLRALGEKGVRAIQAFQGALRVMHAPTIEGIDGYLRNLETTSASGIDPFFRPALSTPLRAINRRTRQIGTLILKPGEAVPKDHMLIAEFMEPGR